MYGDFLEALIGGIYLEKGYENKRICSKNIIDKKPKAYQNKKIIREGLYLLNNKKVNFVKTDHRGPDHDRLHKVELMIDGESQMTEWASSPKKPKENYPRPCF